MPLPGGLSQSDVRYRFKTLPNGKKVRLAFKKGTNKVVEVKSYESIFGHKSKKHGRS